jgi:hypothetical protein
VVNSTEKRTPAAAAALGVVRRRNGNGVVTASWSHLCATGAVNRP